MPERSCEICGARNMVDDETDLCDTCWCALSDDKSIEEARLEVEDMAAWGSRHFGRADGKRCTCGTVDHIWIQGPKVRGRGAGTRWGHVDLDVKHEQGCPLAPPVFDWPEVDEDARERIFGYRGIEHHRGRLLGALYEILEDRQWELERDAA